MLLALRFQFPGLKMVPIAQHTTFSWTDGTSCGAHKFVTYCLPTNCGRGRMMLPVVFSFYLPKFFCCAVIVHNNTIVCFAQQVYFLK
uniref:Uncharacterized protein n=1 Tax=Arundo donax TaxID=35708 RepID=A0A0A9H2L0_ARUDO